MATFIYNQAAADILSGTLNLATRSGLSKLKIMLVNAGYTPNKDHTVVDNGGNDASDPSFNEIVATNYTSGYGGAGRLAVTATFGVDNGNDRAAAALSQPTWTTLGGATNDTIRGAILFDEGASDAASRLIAFFDLPGGGSGILTNGSDFLLQFASLVAGGNLRLNC